MNISLDRKYPSCRFPPFLKRSRFVKKDCPPLKEDCVRNLSFFFLSVHSAHSREEKKISHCPFLPNPDPSAIEFLSPRDSYCLLASLSLGLAFCLPVWDGQVPGSFFWLSLGLTLDFRKVILSAFSLETLLTLKEGLFNIARNI